MFDDISVETEVKMDRFILRDYQRPLMDALENKRYKRALCIWPRRAGKDLTAFNFVIREALRKVGVYFIVYPTYSQGRKILWESMTNDGTRFLDFIPPELVQSTNSTMMQIRLKNESLIQVLGSDNYDCYDDQTEILTDDGWKLFRDLDDTSRVGYLEYGVLKFNRPTARQSYDYDGIMYRGLSKSIDFKVTPNHRFWVCSSKGVYKFKKISDPTIKNDCIPATSDWIGIYWEQFKLDDGISIPMGDFVALLGIFLAEGSTYSDKKTYRVTICQNKKNIRNDIRELLDRIGLNYWEGKDRFDINSKALYKYLSQFGLQHERFIPTDIKYLKPAYLSILFEWLVKGDGSITSAGTFYYSTSKRLIDDVQEILIKIGKSGNISIRPQSVNAIIRGRKILSTKTLYMIRVRDSKFKRLMSSKKEYITTEQYKGKVYCVTVPSGVIKVRRNGKECWSGNSLVGTNPIGIIFSEYALQDPRAYQFLRPVLTANDGWALFISTPRGKNHLWEMYNIAVNNPEHWFCSKLTVLDTGHISMNDIEREQQSGEMSEDLIQQEYFTSFEMGVEGAYYAKYIDKMRLSGRIGIVPYESGFKVHTAWDIGRDMTSIIFFQCIGQVVRIIDAYENSGQGLEYYVKILNQKPYAGAYGRHIGPHDLRVKEWASGQGMTRVEKARQLGINFTICTEFSIEDGIEAVRSTLGRVWIDQSNCAGLIKALENYRKEYDAKRKVYKDMPLHDWSSHYCDSFRYLVLSLPKTKDGISPEQLEQRYREAMYGDQGAFPPMFRDTNNRY